MQTSNMENTPQLPRFEQEISIVLPVEMIYRKMLETLPVEYKHRETLAHAIIGSTVGNGKVAYIYNALAGFTNEIDFQIGDRVACTSKDRQESYDYNLESSDGEEKPAGIEIKERDGTAYKPNWSVRDVAIGDCEVVEIDMYSDKKLKVQFIQDKRYNGGKETVTEWVNHKTCQRWAKAGELTEEVKQAYPVSVEGPAVAQKVK